MQAGCAFYLKKPVQVEALYRAVQSAIETTPRQNIRINTYLKVAIEGGTATEGAVAAEYATVLSENGMYVMTLNPRQVNMRIAVSFVIKNSAITAVAQVLYSHSLGDGPFKDPGMGMKFISISAEDRTLLREYISERLMEGITPLRDE